MPNAVAAASLELAERLRDAGLAVVLESPSRGLGKSLKSAHRSGLERVLLLGEDELAQRGVTIRELASGEQGMIAAERLADELARRADSKETE